MALFKITKLTNCQRKLGIGLRVFAVAYRAPGSFGSATEFVPLTILFGRQVIMKRLVFGTVGRGYELCTAHLTFVYNILFHSMLLLHCFRRVDGGRLANLAQFAIISPFWDMAAFAYFICVDQPHYSVSLSIFAPQLGQNNFFFFGDIVSRAMHSEHWDIVPNQSRHERLRFLCNGS